MKKVFSILLSAMLCAAIVVTECPTIPIDDQNTPPTITAQELPDDSEENDGIDPLVSEETEDDF